MIDRVHVQGFKSLSDVTVELGRFNVFVGANGSGKTNLLEAIGLLGCAVSGRVNDEAFKHRGVRPGLPSLFKTALRQPERIRRMITLEAAAGDAVYRCGLDNPITHARPEWQYTHEAVLQGERRYGSRSPRGVTLAGGPRDRRVERTAGIVPAVRLHLDDGPVSRLLDDLEHFAIYTPFTPMLRGTVQDPSQRRPLGLSGGGLAEAWGQLARNGLRGLSIDQVLELVDWADAIGESDPAAAQLSPAVPTTRRVLRFRDRYMVRERSWLSAFDASEGALYVTFLLTLILHPESPRVVGVDNLDQALNPRLARALVQRVQAQVLDRNELPQLLLTTHNPLVLDALKLGDDRVRLFVVERDREGATQVRRVPLGDALEKAQKTGMTLSRLWVMGMLGGVPSL